MTNYFSSECMLKRAFFFICLFLIKLWPYEIKYASFCNLFLLFFFYNLCRIWKIMCEETILCWPFSFSISIKSPVVGFSCMCLNHTTTLLLCLLKSFSYSIRTKKILYAWDVIECCVHYMWYWVRPTYILSFNGYLFKFFFYYFFFSETTLIK